MSRLEISHRFWLLLDQAKDEGQFMAECSACGAITTRSIDEVWRFGIVVCECNLEMAVLPEHLQMLRAQAREMESKLAGLLSAH